MLKKIKKQIYLSLGVPIPCEGFCPKCKSPLKCVIFGKKILIICRKCCYMEEMNKVD